MFFRMYNKVSSSNNIVINNPILQQNTTQTIQNVNSPYTFQKPINTNYNFLVRKNQYLINREAYEQYMFNTTYYNTVGLYKSKDYINTLLSEDRSIEQIINKKVNSYDLNQNVTQIIENYNSENGINNVSSINQTIQNAINALNEEKQKLLNDINIHSYQAISLLNQNMNNTIQNINSSVNSTLQNALSAINTNTNTLNNTINNINVTLNNSLQQATSILNENNTNISNSLQVALIAIENKTSESLNDISSSVNTSVINNALQEALTTMNTEKQEALTQINISAYNAISNITNLVDDNSSVNEIKSELLQKIDYIFEMFFHANSNIIMENYPL